MCGLSQFYTIISFLIFNQGLSEWSLSFCVVTKLRFLDWLESKVADSTRCRPDSQDRSDGKWKVGCEAQIKLDV